MTALMLAAGAVLLCVAGIYNRLVALRKRTRKAWVQVDIQLVAAISFPIWSNASRDMSRTKAAGSRP